MKKLLIITVLSLMASVSGVWAQASANTQSNAGREGSSSVNKASKANNSQLKGLGVPFNKEKQQFGKSISPSSKSPIPPSSVSDGSDVSDAAGAKKGITPGSHTAQRERRVGYKSPAKTTNSLAKKSKQ